MDSALVGLLVCLRYKQVVRQRLDSVTQVQAVRIIDCEHYFSIISIMGWMLTAETQSSDDLKCIKVRGLSLVCQPLNHNTFVFNCQRQDKL